MRDKAFAVGLVLAGLFSSGEALAQSAKISSDIVGDNVINVIREWVGKPVVVLSVDAQNKRYTGLGSGEIDALDKQWRAERTQTDQPLIAAVLSNPLSNYLTLIQAGSAGLYTEMFVMDKLGLNVGQSAITSDFWQGDEGKFQKTYPNGPTAIFIDEAEFHDGTKTWRTQANLTIVNANQQPIGAITVEINLTELSRRMAAN